MSAATDGDNRADPIRLELSPAYQLNDVRITEISFGIAPHDAAGIVPGGLAPDIIGHKTLAPGSVAPAITAALYATNLARSRREQAK